MRKARTACLLILFLNPTLYLIAQIDFPETLRARFDSYGKERLTEKLYCHTDKVTYLTGEICWFKIYDVDGYFHRPLGISRVAYVELIDLTNQPRIQVKISLDSGKGEGSFFLPTSLKTGNYIFRAYTSWMKNFSADYFFEKRLCIINAQRLQEVEPASQALIYDIGFFPEGGNLVNSLSSTVAFRIADQYGRGTHAEGWLCDDQSDTLLSIQTLKFGMGHFVFTPLAHHRYKAIIRVAGEKEMVKELPRAYDSGCVMSLIDRSDEQIKVEVRQPRTVADDFNKVCYLFVHTRGLFKWAVSQNMVNGLAIFEIPKDRLGDGISQLTIFDSGRRPVCERLYFKYPTAHIGFSVQVNRQDSGRRKKIELSIFSGEGEDKPIATNCSIAVYRLDSLQSVDQDNIANYLWLSSDLKGRVESPDFYFASKEPETLEAMDNLMLTQGWRRFYWKDLLTGKKPAFEFLPEFNGHIISGRIIDQRTQKKIANIQGFVSIPGPRKQLRTALSDDQGRVRFQMRDFVGSESIIAQTDASKDSNYHIEISNPFSSQYTINRLPQFVLPEKEPYTVLDNSIAMQVQNLYLGKKLQQVNLPIVDSNAFYGQPDERYLLDNYTRFTTMEEVLREYIRAVNVQKKAGKFHLSLSDFYSKLPYDQDPLVLLDGVPVFDMDKIVAYDPLKVKKLELVAKKYLYVSSSFYGILNFTTYTGDLNGFDLDPRALVIDYSGLQYQRIFYAPEYQTQQQLDSHLPDFRQLLFWEPDLSTNEQGRAKIRFFSSDLPGRYVAVIQGLTQNGICGSQMIFFEIN